MIVEAVVSRTASEQQEFLDYRKGIVQAVDTTGPLWMLQIAGRWMPYVDETIAVGDLVLYDDDFQDPFAWVRPEEAGDFTGQWRPYGEQIIAGTWFPRYDDRDDQGDIRAPSQPEEQGPTWFKPQFADPFLNPRLWDKGLVFYHFQRNPGYDGTIVNVEDYILDHGWEGDNPLTTPVDPPYEDPGDPSYYWLDDEGFSFAVSGSVIGDGNLGGGHWHIDDYTWFQTGAFPTVTTYSIQHFLQSRLVFPDCVGIRQVELSDTIMMGDGDVHSFPTISAPGKDWLVVFILFVRPHSLDDYDPGYSETMEYEYDSDDHTLHIGQAATQQILTAGTHLVFSGTTKRAGQMAPTVSLEGTPRPARLASFVFLTDQT